MHLTHLKIRINSLGLNPPGNIAGNVNKITISAAFRTTIGLSGCYQRKTAGRTHPVSHTASWANISDESVRSSISTLCTRPYIVFIVHLYFLLKIYCKLIKEKNYSAVILGKFLR